MISSQKRAPFTRRTQAEYTLKDLIQMTPFHTSSIMFRNYSFLRSPPSFWWEIRFGDKGLYLQLAQQGTIGYLNRVMSHYRYHGQGIYSNLSHREIVRGILNGYHSMISFLTGEQRELAIRCLGRQYLRGARFGVVKRDPAFVIAMLRKYCKHRLMKPEISQMSEVNESSKSD